MNGFISKRQAAWNKFSDPWLGIAEWKEEAPALVLELQGDPLFEPFKIEKQVLKEGNETSCP